MKKIFSISDQSTKAIFWKPKQVFIYKLIFFVISIKDLYIMILHAFFCMKYLGMAITITKFDIFL